MLQPDEQHRNVRRTYPADAGSLPDISRTDLFQFLPGLDRDGADAHKVEILRDGDRLQAVELADILLLLFDVPLVLDRYLGLLHGIVGDVVFDDKRLDGRERLPHIGHRNVRAGKDPVGLAALRQGCRLAFFEQGSRLSDRHGELAEFLYQPFSIAHLPFYPLQRALVHRSQFVSQGGKTDVRIVPAKQGTVLGPGSKHPIGFLRAFGDQVVDEHPGISLVAPQNERRTPRRFQRRIDPRHEALASRLLVTRGTVYLSGEIQVFHPLGLQGGPQLRRRKIVVLDGVARAEHPRIFKTLDFSQGAYLNILGQRR